MNVKAQLVDELFPNGETAAPGSFKFYRQAGVEGEAGLHFVCPCGCGSVLGVQFKRPPNESGPVWSWNGDRDKPSTTPSIRRIGGCEWHGYLTDGEFRTC